VKAALIQYDVDLGRAPEKSRALAVAKVHEAAQDGADLVILPELWLHGAFDPEPWHTGAEPLDGETARAMGRAAADCGVVLHAGSIVERAADGRLYNTSLVFDARGGLLAWYRKIHRFGFDQGEAAVMSPGDKLVTFDLPGLGGAGHGRAEQGEAGHDEARRDRRTGRIGLATCYDVRFPELYRGLLDAGAQILIQVAAWPSRRVEHWRTLLRARAIENQVLVLACSAVGSQADIEMAGHSLVIDPWGEIVAEGGTGEEIVYARIDPAAVTAIRERFPVLNDRRL
jgi:predicted amidohydrolase